MISVNDDVFVECQGYSVKRTTSWKVVGSTPVRSTRSSFSPITPASCTE